MARIIVGVYMFRYPLGGMLSWALQYLRGLSGSGHEVYVVEKANYSQACYDPSRKTMTDDPSEGIRIVNQLLNENGLGDCWCMVDVQGRASGPAAQVMKELFRTADLFIDCGTHGAWLDEAAALPCRILIDGEPSYTQMRWQMRRDDSETLPAYDHYFTNGLLYGTSACTAPAIDKTWLPIPNPVDTTFYKPVPEPDNRTYTTVMNWSSHQTITYKGENYGQKDVEFEKFITLPCKTDCRMEVAVAGNNVPVERLRANDWHVRDAHEVTHTLDAYRSYIVQSAGEFGVCKQVFVATHNGWFSDRSAAYLASGRPVILQDTGFSKVLPTGKGLFAVNTVEEAVASLESISADYKKHSRAAREVAEKYLDAKAVMGGVLDAVGIR